MFFVFLFKRNLCPVKVDKLDLVAVCGNVILDSNVTKLAVYVKHPGVCVVVFKPFNSCNVAFVNSNDLKIVLVAKLSEIFAGG